MQTLPESWPFSRPLALLTDLDDTVLDGGQLHSSVLQALESLHHAGIAVVASTGRPAGWAEVAAHHWPIFGAIGENGSMAYRRVGKVVQTHDCVPPDIRAERMHQLRVLRTQVQEAFPWLRDAGDVRGRVTDHAWDIAETQDISVANVSLVRAFLEAHGARTATSSIHLHATFDTHDKATGALAFLYRELQIDPAVALDSVPFIGDSANDRPCFSAFAQTVGVANIDGQLHALPRPPLFRTKGARGHGFCELTRSLLAACG